MEPFNLWAESVIFMTVFSVIIIVPCILVALIGRDMIDQIGYFPTKTPIIQILIHHKAGFPLRP